MPDVAPASLDAAQQAILVPATMYYLSVHSADPGGTGANEGPDGRQPIHFAASSAGTQSSTDAQTWPAVIGGTTYANFGVWSAPTAGTYLRGGLLARSVVPPPGTQLQFAPGAVVVNAGVILRFAPFYGHKPSGSHFYNGVTTQAQTAAAVMNFSGHASLLVNSVGQGIGVMNFNGAAIMVMGLRATGVGAMVFSGRATAWFVPPYCIVVTSPRARPLVSVTGRAPLLVGAAGRVPHQVSVAGRVPYRVTVKSGKILC